MSAVDSSRAGYTAITGCSSNPAIPEDRVMFMLGASVTSLSESNLRNYFFDGIALFATHSFDTLTPEQIGAVACQLLNKIVLSEEPFESVLPSVQNRREDGRWLFLDGQNQLLSDEQFAACFKISMILANMGFVIFNILSPSLPVSHELKLLASRMVAAAGVKIHKMIAAPEFPRHTDSLRQIFTQEIDACLAQIPDELLLLYGKTVVPNKFVLSAYSQGIDVIGHPQMITGARSTRDDFFQKFNIADYSRRLDYPMQCFRINFEFALAVDPPPLYENL